MNSRKTIEVWVGLFVAAGLLALAMLAFKVGNLTSADVVDGYTLNAKFSNIGGLKTKAPVTMAGVRIGRVTKIGFDNERYMGVIEMQIDGRYKNIPKDTSASILTSGLLGDQYVGLDPGGSEEYLKSSDTIQMTQSAVVLEKLIGQFLFSKAAEGDNKKSK
jgi:phospholipid/cholesterol/gamma-HCH transport system substrate-binding protein